MRPALPAPARGALPLPAGVPAERLAYAPARVEDLNAVVPAGHPQLATPERDARVRRLRAVGGRGCRRPAADSPAQRTHSTASPHLARHLTCMPLGSTHCRRECWSLWGERARRWRASTTTSSSRTRLPPTLTPATACWAGARRGGRPIQRVPAGQRDALVAGGAFHPRCLPPTHQLFPHPPSHQTLSASTHPPCHGAATTRPSLRPGWRTAACRPAPRTTRSSGMRSRRAPPTRGGRAGGWAVGHVAGCGGSAGVA